MSILQPKVVTIGGRRYRKNPFSLDFRQQRGEEQSSSKQQQQAYYEPYEEETEDMFLEDKYRAAASKDNDVEYQDEACMLDAGGIKTCKAKPAGNSDDFKDIRETNNGSFTCTVNVPSACVGYIIGRNSEKKRRLEQNTKTTINIPKRSDAEKSTQITIQGKLKPNVASCRNQILLFVIECRQTRSFTHLITFPFKFDGIKKSLEAFKIDVMRECSADRGVVESIFQNPHKLHLTVCTLTLFSESEIDEARLLFDRCRKTFIDDLLTKSKQELRVRVKGLEYMNDDPAAVDVLYAKVATIETTPGQKDPIQLIADKLMDTFVDSGFTKRQYDRVKLHLTVINSLRRQENETAPAAEAATATSKGRESFDARNILRLFSDYDFGTYTLNELDLSVRYTVAQDGYYESAAKINF